MLCFSTLKNMLVDFFFRAILSIPSTKGWSNSMAQYNLIRYCLNERPPRCRAFQKILGIYQWLEKQRYKDSKDVSSDLKKLIFEQLVKKSRGASNFRDCRKLCAQRGKWVLENETGASNLNCLDKFGWSIEVDFDQSILLWHIATDLCYYSDTDSVDYANRKASKLLSDYMLYLLVVCPFMLPNGIGQIRFRDMCAETIEFFEARKSITAAKGACTMLLKVSVEVPPSEVKGDRSKSVLFDACRLCKIFASLGQCPDTGAITGAMECREKMGLNNSNVGGNTILCSKPVSLESSCSAAQARWRAAHSCLASYGSSWFNGTISNIRGPCKG